MHGGFLKIHLTWYFQCNLNNGVLRIDVFNLLLKRKYKSLIKKLECTLRPGSGGALIHLVKQAFFNLIFQSRTEKKIS